MLNVTQGSRAILPCNVTGGDPPPEIVWFKDHAPLGTGGNPTMVLNADRSELTIGDARLTDDGRYQCMAANAAGNANQTIILNVGGD